MRIGKICRSPSPNGYSSYLVEFPFERTEHYYSTAVELRWITGMSANDESFSQNYLLKTAPSVFEPGRSYERRFNAPVHAIALPEVTPFGPNAIRQGDTLSIYPSMYADSAGNDGFVTTEGRTVLYRDGELVGESASGAGGSFDVPPERASYRFELDTTLRCG